MEAVFERDIARAQHPFQHGLLKFPGLFHLVAHLGEGAALAGYVRRPRYGAANVAAPSGLPKKAQTRACKLRSSSHCSGEAVIMTAANVGYVRLSHSTNSIPLAPGSE